MRFKQANPLKASVKYRQYSPSTLTDAYFAVKEKKLSVSKASKIYQVPMQTLRDRVLGKIDIDTSTSGRAPVLSLEEEAKLVNHLQEVAKLGYGYSRQEVVDVASDYAFELGKRSKDQPLTLNWFVKCVGRWPELRVLKPRSLDIQRAKSASSAAVDSYFVELEKILVKYDLKDKPHLIYNVDEKGITQDHKPPYIVAGKDYHPQSVTAGRSKTTTILGCGSASGVAVPPYFVFAGKRMLPELMTGATPGAAGTVSDSGWSNSTIFREYLQGHFINNIPQREPGQHLLLLLDGHKSHISVSLLEWAKLHEIVLFVLPAHTSHILQPLDVGCYGPFQKMYHNECHKFMRSTSCAVTRYDICSLACKVYSKALSAENLHGSFLKTGIFPLDKTTISKESTMPAEVFIQPDNGENLENEAADVGAKSSETQNQTDNISPSLLFATKINSILAVKRENNKKPRKHLGTIVSGQPITESAISNKISAHQTEQGKTNKGGQKSKTGKYLQLVRKPSSSNLSQSKVRLSKENVVLQGPSHINITDSLDETDESDMEITDDEKCCICKKFTPDEVRNSVSVIFTKWVKCDGEGCSHWAHLKYCTTVSVIRRGDTFFCPHCISGEE